MPKHKHLVKNGLSPKQQRFCEEYVKDMNGTQAAIRAGYSEKTANEQSSRLLAKIHIQTRISELAKAITKRNGITPERILNELAILGFSRIDDHLVIDEGGGVRIKRFDEYDDEAKLAAIRKIKEDRVIREVPKADGTEEVVVHDKISFELHDKIRPLVKLGEYVKLFDSELPGGGVSQVVNNDFKIMIMAVNGDKIKEIDFSKMIETGKKQANVE